MSYDVYLMADTGGPEPVEVFWRNYTSNCSPMWCKAGADLAEMHGRDASECAPILSAAIGAMTANPAEYEAMNPPNGWGDYVSCLDFLRGLRDACQSHPKTKVEISR